MIRFIQSLKVGFVGLLFFAVSFDGRAEDLSALIEWERLGHKEYDPKGVDYFDPAIYQAFISKHSYEQKFEFLKTTLNREGVSNKEKAFSIALLPVLGGKKAAELGVAMLSFKYETIRSGNPIVYHPAEIAVRRIGAAAVPFLLESIKVETDLVKVSQTCMVLKLILLGEPYRYFSLVSPLLSSFDAEKRRIVRQVAVIIW